MYPVSGSQSERVKLIRRYLTGQLSELEKKEFEQQLTHDSILKRDTEFMSNLYMIYEQPELIKAGKTLLALRAERLRSARLEGNKTEPGRSFPRLIPKTRNLLIGSAMILLLLFLLLIINNIIIFADHDQLFKNYLQPHPSIFSQTTSAPPSLRSAINNYDNRNWKEASRLFEEYTNVDPIYQFYYAVATVNLSKDDYQQDLERFIALKKELEMDQPVNKNLIAWVDYYIALITIKQGDFNQGKHMISALAKRENLDTALHEVIDKMWFRLLFLFY